MPPIRMRSEIWDEMHHNFTDFNDHTIRVRLNFNSRLDFSVLQKAFRAVCNAVPILKCRYVTGFFKNRWEEIKGFNAESYVKKTDDANAAESFFTSVFNEEIKAQFAAMLLNAENSDVLYVLFNHMCFDGRAVRTVVSLLAKAYCGLVINENFRLAPVEEGSRDFWRIYGKHDFFTKLKLFSRVGYGKGKSGDYQGFPYEKDAPALKKGFVTRSYDASRFALLKAAAKAENATLNDVFIAAYALALGEITKNTAPIDIDCVVDLRKYLEDDAPVLANMVGKVTVPFDTLADDILKTVRHVRDITSVAKDDFAGYEGLSLLRLGDAFLPTTPLRRLVIRRVFHNPLIALSNIGDITKDAIPFGKCEITDAYMTGAIKFKPYLLLSVVTFKNKISLTFGMKGSEKDFLQAKRLLERIIYYFERFIEIKENDE